MTRRPGCQTAWALPLAAAVLLASAAAAGAATQLDLGFEADLCLEATVAVQATTDAADAEAGAELLLACASDAEADEPEADSTEPAGDGSDEAGSDEAGPDDAGSEQSDPDASDTQGSPASAEADGSLQIDGGFVATAAACPTLKAEALEDGSIRLDLEGAVDADAFLLHRSDLESPIATLGADAATHIDGSAEVGVSYTYALVPVDGEACPSVEVSAIPFFPTALAAALAAGTTLLGYLGVRKIHG